MTPRILFVDDERDMCDVAELKLRSFGFIVETFLSAHQALERLAQEDFDVVVADLRMPGMDGLQLCSHMMATRPSVPVVVVTAFGSLEVAVQAMRAGAYDFVTKPFDFDVLRAAINRAVESQALRREVVRLRAGASYTGRLAGMVGLSTVVEKVYDLVERVAQTDASVFITGESGTGKELVARALHSGSPRKNAPFVALNCSAMPAALLESELFGHVKGAFTDAKTARAGLFVQASGGVIFLDEIGELPMTLQPKLLRALQERKVRPVGGTNEISFDARIVAATNRDLEQMIEEQRFREDLFYRINVIHIPLPPLRARGNDILLMAQHFIEHYGKMLNKTTNSMSAHTAQKLLAYPWPGNVRELQNCIERAVALTTSPQITVEDLPEKIHHWNMRNAEGIGNVAEPDEFLTMDEMERRHILRAIEIHKGNRGLAAGALAIDRKTLYRKLRAFEHPNAKFHHH